MQIERVSGCVHLIFQDDREVRLIGITLSAAAAENMRSLSDSSENLIWNKVVSSNAEKQNALAKVIIDGVGL